MRLLIIILLVLVMNVESSHGQDHDGWSLSERAKVIFESSTRVVPEPEFAIVPTVEVLSPTEVLQKYLAQTGFDLESDDTSQFRLISEKTSPAGKHFRFQQYCDDIPVLGSYLKISSMNQVVSVQGSFNNELDCSSILKKIVDRSAVLSSQISAAFSSEVIVRELGVKTIANFGNGPEILTQSKVTSQEADWSIFSSLGGEIVAIEKYATQGKPVQENLNQLRPSHIGNEIQVPTSDLRLPTSSVTDGSGFVFNPDPLGSSGATHGGEYADNEDADNGSLNAERKLVDLRNLTQLNNGDYTLKGPWVEIVGESAVGAATHSVPVESDPSQFTYTRAEDGFEAVNVYYHINDSQEYLESLGFTDLQRGPIQTNPLDGNNDQSSYFFFSNFISFGAGGIDDAEDASIVWHEYAHAIMESASPGLYVGDEGFAFHEGWADYWAASYQRGLFDQGELASGDWWRVLRWDGNAPTSAPRDLNLSGETYPDYLDQGLGRHAEGRIWGTTMMEVYSQLGKEVTDKLHLQANYLLEFPVTMASAARSIILADVPVNNGANANTLISIFSDIGFVDPTSFGPILTHIELGDREQFPSSINFEVNAIGPISPIQNISVHISFNSGDFEENQLVPGSDPNSFLYTYQSPSEEGTVSYYFESIDLDGRSRLLPENAPDSLFSFFIGRDIIPPSITHNSPEIVTIQDWPPRISAIVTDNISLNLVWVAYVGTRDDQFIWEHRIGMDLQEDGSYLIFDIPPVARNEVQAGDRILYRIHARDDAFNLTTLPPESDPPFEMVVGDDLLLYSFGAENSDSRISFEGAWERGEPNFGLETAFDGTSVYGINLESAYPNIPSTSELRIGPIDTFGFEDAHLVFRHWYDTEFNRSSNVDSTNGHFLWDGGNVEYSFDDGVTWSLLQPRNGYSGQIFGAYQNPLADERAFGGNSYGWQKEYVPLPESRNMLIRFRFGTDSDNRSPSKFYAGWFLDQIRISGELFIDDDPPSIGPIVNSPRFVDSGPNYEDPKFEAFVHDASGVDSVIVHYEMTRKAFVQIDTLRLDVDPKTKSFYQIVLDLDGDSLKSGDEVSYYVYAVDEFGNATRWPRSESRNIVYRRISESDRLNESTTTGAWTALDDGWSISPLRHKAPTSSLLPPPINLAENADDLYLIMEHRYEVDSLAAGFLSLSNDEGATWKVIEPVRGYDVYDLLDHGVWTGSSAANNRGFSSFDLSLWRGQTVQIRIDFFSNHGLSTQTLWNVSSLRMIQKSGDDEFNFPQDFALHPNYPDPSSISTTVSYVMDGVDFVKLTLFDSMGRVVKVLDSGKKEIGTYQLQVDVSDLAPAVYFLLLESEDRGLVRSESVTVF